MEENHQQAAEHLNQMIWIVFGSGVALSLWILYNNISGNKNPLVLTFGFVVLLYSLMLIISFGQQKSIHYLRLRGNNNDLFLYGRRYLRVRYVGETILLTITLTYFLFLLKNLFPIFKEISPHINLDYLLAIIFLFLFLIVGAYNFYISSIKKDKAKSSDSSSNKK